MGNKEAVASIMVQAQGRAENLRTIISDVRSAGHTTGLRRNRDNHASQEDGGAPSARRVEWITDLGVEEPIRGDEQRIGPFADEGRQSHVGIALAADVEDTEPPPQSFRRKLKVFDLGFDIRRWCVRVGLDLHMRSHATRAIAPPCRAIHSD